MPAQGGGPMAEPLGRLHLLTDCRPGRDPVPVVRAALSVGVPVVQVRVPDGWSDRAAYALASVVAGLCREAGATCLINDRLDVALAVGADGAHVGADDLPVAAARRVLGNAILGGTARDPATARQGGPGGAAHPRGGLAGRGCAVTVYDPAPGAGASHVAAGMLSPAGEAGYGERELTALAVESARRWPAFAAALTAESGVDTGYRADGTLLVARTEDDLAELRRHTRYQLALGFPVTAAGGSELPALEPGPAPATRGGAAVPHDH